MRAQKDIEPQDRIERLSDRMKVPTGGAICRVAGKSIGRAGLLVRSRAITSIAHVMGKQ